MIVHPDNIEAGKGFGLRHRFKVCTGALYLGGFIGGEESKRDYLKERTQTWEQNNSQDQQNREEISPVNLLRSVMCDPIGVDILQCITKNARYAFAGVDKSIWETFLQ